MRYRLTALLAAFAALQFTFPSQAAAAADGWEMPAMDVASAHSLSKGEGATVAVIDTGIQTGHPALKGRAQEGPDFLKSKEDRSESWYGKHGTSMASSVLDVAPAAKVLGLRGLRDEADPRYKDWEEAMREGGSTDSPSSIGNAVHQAVKSHADVISMSLGNDERVISPYDSHTAMAIQYAISKGVVVVASAGNSGDLSREDSQNNLHYPAGYPGVIAVAATQPDGSRASFSSVHNYIDLAAPGVGISSADIKGGRSQVDGTSSATALVAGAAALIVSKYPELAPRQVEQSLKRTASTASQGHNPLTGYGTIDANSALRAAGKLEPGSPALPVSDKNADVHFGPGDDGTPARTEVGRDPEYTMAAATIGGAGLLVVILGTILTISGVRIRRRSHTDAV